MITAGEIERAAEAIRAGQLVIFPTETVYGLGANALDAEAITRIFVVKGRPATSPLIVHAANLAMARALAEDWPSAAEMLAARFWPGPLTLVVPKRDAIPDNVTAGLDTVGLRVPSHPMALALLRAAGVPIAAPSANRFTELSPTRVDHLTESLARQAAVVLDGGPTSVGIESTVVAVSERGVELLRAGMISRAEIETVVGPLITSRAESAAHRSPGQHVRHYQPRTRLLVTSTPPISGRGVFLTRAAIGGNPENYARQLYGALHDLDMQALDWIALEPVPESVEWDGIRDRLQRAASE